MCSCCEGCWSLYLVVLKRIKKKEKSWTRDMVFVYTEENPEFFPLNIKSYKIYTGHYCKL